MVIKSASIARIVALAAISIAISPTPSPAGTDVAQQSSLTQGSRFERVEQPLWGKIAVTAGGLSLIGLELWWFLKRKPQAQSAATQSGVQAVTIVVDGGYSPSHIVVRAGQPVRLDFDRQDPSSCLAEVRIPDFRIARALPVDRTTAIEFTPDKPGIYQFSCGMNMFRGEIEVQPAS